MVLKQIDPLLVVDELFAGQNILKWVLIQSVAKASYSTVIMSNDLYAALINLPLDKSLLLAKLQSHFSPLYSILALDVQGVRGWASEELACDCAQAELPGTQRGEELLAFGVGAREHGGL